MDENNKKDLTKEDFEKLEGTAGNADFSHLTNAEGLEPLQPIGKATDFDSSKDKEERKIEGNNENFKKMMGTLSNAVRDSSIPKKYNDYVISAFKDWLILKSARYINVEAVTGVSYETFLNHYAMTRLLLADYIGSLDETIEKMDENGFREQIGEAVSKKSDEYKNKDYNWDSDAIKEEFEKYPTEYLQESMKTYFANGRMQDGDHETYSEYVESLSDEAVTEATALDVDRCFDAVEKTGIYYRYLGYKDDHVNYTNQMDCYIDQIKEHIIRSNEAFGCVRKDYEITPILRKKIESNNNANDTSESKGSK